MTSYSLRRAAPDRTGADAVVVGLLAPERPGRAARPTLAPGAEGVAEAYGRRLPALLSTLGLTGKAGETALVPTNGTLRSPLLLLVGLGREVTGEAVRRAAGTAARTLKNVASVALALPSDDPALVRAAAEGYALGAYRFDTFRSKEDDDRPNEVIVLAEGARRQEYADAVAVAETVAAAVARTRDWVNTPPGDLRPSDFVAAVKQLQRDHRKQVRGSGGGTVAVKVWDEAALREEGCGGLLGVGAGSDDPPALVRLTYKPADARCHLALVGKGVTFDSGGLSIKPGSSMGTMKMDMAGAASVVHATFAIAALGLPVRVTAYAPLAENMISGSATRPGDVLTMKGGTTVEVLNTDAEGRLILADALGFAVADAPDLIVDVATLTGACVVALGDRVAGVFGNDDAAIERVVEVSAQAGEAMWPMPIPEEMGEKVRGNSRVADLAQHNVDRWGGASYAAAFLREFVADRSWVHLDIAGPAFNEKSAYGHVTPGGTGMSVATLVELARDLGERGVPHSAAADSSGAEDSGD